MEEIKKSIQQTLIVSGRKSLTLNCVKNVDSLDESYVSLSTDGGRVAIEGEGLKIESLSKEGGNVLVTGVIGAVYYSDDTPKKHSIFSRRAK